MNHNDELQARVTEMAGKVCTELFAAYDVPLRESKTAWGAANERQLSGVVGFVGQRIRGTCVLAGSAAPLAASSPVEGRLRDWVGELANQLAGRLKSRFLEFGLEVHLTTPVVLSGMRLEPIPSGNLAPTIFSAEGGQILVCVEIEAREDIVLGSIPPVAHGSEGDVMLF